MIVESKEDILSSDNGVYVGEFPTQSGEKEYRVIHAQAIENVDFGDQEMQDYTRVSYFGNAISFGTLELAVEEASFLANKVLDDCGLLEYGISILKFDRPLLNKTVEEAEALLEKKWDEDFPPVSSDDFLDEDEYQLVEPPPLPKSRFLVEDDVKDGEPRKVKFSDLRSYPGMNGFSVMGFQEKEEK